MLHSNSAILQLAEFNQWTVWRAVERDSRLTKVPYDPNTGRPASVTEPSTWADLSTAKECLEYGNFNGLGFVLTDTDPFCGWDLDDCLEDGVWADWAMDIVRRLNSYTEITPSGKGLRILCKANLPVPGRRSAGVEVYTSSRFLTITGEHLIGTPTTIEDRAEECLDIFNRLFDKPQRATETADRRSSWSLTNEALIESAITAKNGDKFRRLWAGDTSGHRGDASAADLALCSILAFWSNNDRARIDQLFRQSGLMRKKWDRKTGNRTYGELTLEKALNTNTEFYMTSTEETASEKPSCELRFPQTSMVGSIGDLARVLAAGTEVPEEFYFCAGLTYLGAMVGHDLTLDIGTAVDPRLYTVILGESYGVRKSTSIKKTRTFFESLKNTPKVIAGVGSAEGLIREMETSSNVVLALDELRAFVDKTKVQGSTLLSMVTSLFEQGNWDNTTKTGQKHLTNVRLSLIGCCTTDTYESMWTDEAIAIGFPNRLFIVSADRQERVACPARPDEEALRNLRERIQVQLARLPKKLSLSDDAHELWKAWYDRLPASEHARRLDTIGFRLLALFALTTDKSEVDGEVVEVVLAILDYELRLRMLTDPIDADGKIAKLENKIRRTLASRGSLSIRDLRRLVSADRVGLWAFYQALRNLKNAHDVHELNGKWSLKEAA